MKIHFQDRDRKRPPRIIMFQRIRSLSFGSRSTETLVGKSIMLREEAVRLGTKQGKTIVPDGEELFVTD